MASKPNYPSTNKSERDINKQFDQRQFNDKFIKQDEKIIQEQKISKSDDMTRPHEIIQKTLPHQKPVSDVIINIREMFYKSIEMLIDKKNPLEYILSSPDRHFAFATFLIIIGTLLLLLSNLMKS